MGGHSQLVVLVGESPSGKTRACWEAVRTRPPDWRHPIAPSQPNAIAQVLDDALVSGMRIAPRTVIWLNETQHYLFNAADPKLVERIAAGLPALLVTPERGPVLILGTIWPDHVAALAGPPATEVDDRHAQARALLAGGDLAVTSTLCRRRPGDREGHQCSTAHRGRPTAPTGPAFLTTGHALVRTRHSEVHLRNPCDRDPVHARNAVLVAHRAARAPLPAQHGAIEVLRRPQIARGQTRPAGCPEHRDWR
ncbi:hypothetical protein [Streptomyces mirabilis]|uniref:hypothetical protein n=1 Tax=Streptomyces mirabilis TaxID=68239 RepID=UPI00352FE517